MNAPQCYGVRTLPVLLNVVSLTVKVLITASEVMMSWAYRILRILTFLGGCGGGGFSLYILQSTGLEVVWSVGRSTNMYEEKKYR